MGLIDTLAARLGYAKAADMRPPAVMLSAADSQRWEMPDASVAERQASLYTQLTWISTAIDRVAEIGSAGIFSVKKTGTLQDTDDDDEDIPNHEFEMLLRKPNPAQSRGEFLRDALSFYKTTGNLYLHMNKPNETVPPDELWIVPTQMMTPIPDGKSYVSGYWFEVPGKAKEFVPRWQIVHLKTWNPFSPFVGLSAIQSLALDAFGDLAQQRWNLELFGKNNGKLPLILAFKHMIADPEWGRLLKARDEEWTGANRAGVMLLRGVGDTVQLVQATATQKEMEFLASRTFTKEEIYDKLAPGLASILSVNATEANAIAGKSTLIEFAVWPLLDQLAQKFSSDVLPLYGEGLVGEFDDMRQTNRIIDMQEQEAYERSHTINEIRAEYYDEDPLELDPSVIKQIEAAEAEQEEIDANPPEPVAQPPQTAVVPFGKKAAMPVNKLDPRGFLFPAQISPTTPNPADVPKPTPPPSAMVPAQSPITQPEGDAVPDRAAVGEELAKWEKFALRHLGKDAREFEPRVMPFMQAARVQAALKTAKSVADVRTVFERERDDPNLLEIGRKLTAAIERATERLG
jgi:phage portal protein BeeE